MPDNDGGRARDSLLGRVIFGLEAGILTVLFLALVVLGMTQIGMRNFAGTSLPWADGAMRALVIWLTMVGAIVGAGKLRHIRIDLVENWAAPTARVLLRRFAFLATALVCLVLTWNSLMIVALEYEFSQTAFLDVPVWVVQLIIPIGFGIMAARFAAWGLFPPRGILNASDDTARMTGDDQ